MDEDAEVIDVDEASSDGSTAVVEEVRRVLGDMVLTTRVHRKSGEFHANGEGWRIEIRGREGEIAFKPAGGTLRLVRDLDDLGSMTARDRSVVFEFGDSEEILVGRGIEQRWSHE